MRLKLDHLPLTFALMWAVAVATLASNLGLSLMGQVTPDQSWGIAAVTRDRPPGTVIGSKDGWYPEDDG